MKFAKPPVAGMAAVLAVCLIINMPSLVSAQSGSRQGGSGMRQGGSGARQGASQSRTYGAVQSPAPFEERFWGYLARQKYKNWAPVPGKSDGLSEGQSPHGAYIKMYLNRTAAGNPKALPLGSVIIKENYGPDQKTLMAVTVMYRTKGYNPEGGDWYWAKYNADGSIARTPAEKGSKKIAGKFGSCISCHGGAEGNDFAFFNDGP